MCRKEGAGIPITGVLYGHLISNGTCEGVMGEPSGPI